MPRADEAELIRERALTMLRASKHHLGVGDYDLASFLAEQAAQLYLKYVVLKITGEVPRTHSIRELLQILGKITKKENKVIEFIRVRRSMLIRLEEAYLASRYLFRRYDRDEVKELVEFAEELINYVRDL
ncbi:MAG: HEPN domain-containing protein [Desulfurococcales archaeon]|nr:HEPN domain-containing protein [Desulfurococcales archaeon]